MFQSFGTKRARGARALHPLFWNERSISFSSSPRRRSTPRTCPGICPMPRQHRLRPLAVRSKKVFYPRTQGRLSGGRLPCPVPGCCGVDPVSHDTWNFPTPETIGKHTAVHFLNFLPTFRHVPTSTSLGALCLDQPHKAV